MGENWMEVRQCAARIALAPTTAPKLSPLRLNTRTCFAKGKQHTSTALVEGLEHHRSVQACCLFEVETGSLLTPTLVSKERVTRS